VAYDLLKKKTTPGNFAPSSMVSGIPLGALGYAPSHWWTVAQAEAKVQELMKSGGLFGTKLPRENAERDTLAYMRKNEIGVMSGTSSLGSWLLPKKELDRILTKIDDVRYDMRLTGRRVGIGVGCLAGALGLLGVASIYRTQASEPARHYGQIQGNRYELTQVG
jgi:hypothetical protein